MIKRRIHGGVIKPRMQELNSVSRDRQLKFSSKKQKSKRKLSKTIDLTNSPISKYFSPITTAQEPARRNTNVQEPSRKNSSVQEPARRNSSVQEPARRNRNAQPKKLAFNSPMFVPISESSSTRISIRTISSQQPLEVIDLTNEPSSPPSCLQRSTSPSSPIDLCSLSNGSFESKTSTPKAVNLTGTFDQNLFICDEGSCSTKKEPFSSEDYIDDGEILGGHIPILDVTAPLEKNDMPSFQPEIGNEAVLEAVSDQVPMDVSCTAQGSNITTGSGCEMFSSFVARLKKQMRIGNGTHMEELNKLAMERNVPVKPPHFSEELVSTKTLSSHECSFLEALDIKTFNLLNVPIMEAVMIASPHGCAPSSTFLHALCGRIILAENSTEFQQNVAGRILHQLLMWYPPGTSAAMRNTYEQTLRLIGGNATFGLSVVSNVMCPSHPNLLVLKWINNVFLSDLYSFCSKESSSDVHTGKPLVLVLSGIEHHFRHIATQLRQHKEATLTDNEVK
jgi:hypothetical protein